MTVEHVELDYWSWIGEVTQKLTFARLKCLDHKDISEDDYQLLKVLYPIWHRGEYQLFVSKMEGISQSVTQASIFDSISSDTQPKECNGTVIVKEETELITDNDE